MPTNNRANNRANSRADNSGGTAKINERPLQAVAELAQ